MIDYRDYGKDPRLLAERGGKRIALAGAVVMVTELLMSGAGYGLVRALAQVDAFDTGLIQAGVVLSLIAALLGAGMIALRGKCRALFVISVICGVGALVLMGIGLVPARWLDGTGWQNGGDDSMAFVYAMLMSMGERIVAVFMTVVANVFIWPHALAGYLVFGRRDVDEYLKARKGESAPWEGQ